MAALCGMYIYGPVHLRRCAPAPDGAADREVCRACVSLVDTEGIVAPGVLPRNAAGATSTSRRSVADSEIRWPPGDRVSAGARESVCAPPKWQHRLSCRNFRWAA